MSEKHNKWVVKDTRGRIYGPLTTAKVLSYIERGLFAGGEKVAKYPGGTWHIISREPQFYDKLLEALETDATRKPRIPEDAPPNMIQLDPGNENTKIRDHAESENDSKVQEESNRAIELETASPKQTSVHQGKAARVRKEKVKTDNVGGVIDLTDIASLIKKERLRKAIIPAAILLVLIATGIYWLLSAPANFDRIHLLAPRAGQPAISGRQTMSLYNAAVQFFDGDTFRGYLRAEDNLVQIAEGAPRNKDALALLCLTYKELWPFAFQDAGDLATLANVKQRILSIDPTGYDSAICRASLAMIAGKYSEAEGVAQGALESSPGAAALYELMAEIMGAKTSYDVAVGFTQKIQQLWPAWLKPYVTEAIFLEKEGNYSKAHDILKQVLKWNPEHARAKIEMGLIEYKYLQNFDRAQDYLQSALNGDQRLTVVDQTRGYLTLAKVFMKKNEPTKAVAAAQKCYSMNSNDVACSQIIIQLAGYDRLRKTPKEDRDALVIGETFEKTGNCFAAQAEYKAAYEADPKNSTAAYLAGKCLWQLGDRSDAIAWMQNAIQADRKFPDAYTRLAHYQAKVYDFNDAFRTLQQIQSISPGNYKLYQGYAQVEFDRHDYAAAIRFATTALKLYDTDLHTELILSKSYLAIGKFNEAYSSASRAVELDTNNVDANCNYAKVLSAIRGTSAGLHYLDGFINQYPTIIKYRIVDAEILESAEKYNQADSMFKQILTMKPDDEQALLDLGELFQHENKPDDALQSYLRAAAADPSDPEPLFHAGLLYLRAKKYNFAAEQLKRVLELNKRYPKVHYYIGKADLKMGHIKQALHEADMESQVNPGLPEPHLLKAQAYTQGGQYQECANEYQLALKLETNKASETYVKLAQCYQEAGSLDIALSMLDLAAQKESGNPDIYKVQGAVYVQKGDSPAAIKAYSKYLVLAGPGASDYDMIKQKVISLGGSPPE